MSSLSSYALVWVGLSFLLTACNPKAIPTVLFPAKPETQQQSSRATVTISARDIVNPAPDGTPSPVQVRIFSAGESVLFESVSFEQVFEFDGQTFALQPKLTTTIKPGAFDSFSIELGNNDSIVAVAVAFRDIGRTEWLKLVRIDGSKSSTLNFILTEFSVKHESKVN